MSLGKDVKSACCTILLVGIVSGLMERKEEMSEREEENLGNKSWR